MRYTIRVDSCDTLEIDWSVVGMLKSSASYEVIRGRLIKMSRKFSGNVTVLANSCPLLHCRMFDGRMFNEVYVGEKRTKKEIELDHFYAERGKLKNQRLGRLKGDLTSWIKSPVLNEHREGLRMINKENYKLSQKIVSKIHAEKCDFGHQPRRKRGKYASGE